MLSKSSQKSKIQWLEICKSFIITLFTFQFFKEETKPKTPQTQISINKRTLKCMWIWKLEFFFLSSSYFLCVCGQCRRINKQPQILDFHDFLHMQKLLNPENQMYLSGFHFVLRSKIQDFILF